MSEIIRIPEERVRVLIGRDGRTKESIERRCRITLEISDSEVQIKGDPADVYFAADIVKAIGRGFEPRKAMLLLKADYTLHVIALRELFPNEKSMKRIKGRVIGEGGKIRAMIEESTESFLSVYGNTICIIAKIDTMDYAREAVSMILGGANHTSVLNFLSKARRQIMDSRLRS